MILEKGSGSGTALDCPLFHDGRRLRTRIVDDLIAEKDYDDASRCAAVKAYGLEREFLVEHRRTRSDDVQVQHARCRHPEGSLAPTAASGGTLGQLSAFGADMMGGILGA